ncbi:MAG: hypothetical protein IPL79_16810 [Myxococcales bacterium]|nr:hypothetical protein [Myxococcales bacterium]
MDGPLATAAFGRWYPLAAFAEHIEAGVGVFQVKLAKGLIDYPKGKSAMIHYGYGASLRDEVGSLVAVKQTAGGQVDAWMCRHTIEFPSGRVMEAQHLYERLLAQFVSRFGSEPRLPCA